MTRQIAGLLLMLIAVCGAIVFGLYRRDLAQVRVHVREGSGLATTSAGAIEYAGRGNGPAVLAVHGAGGGYDQGLSIAASFLGQGFKVIAPSRFGYLRTPVPQDASPAAQADAHAALLRLLGVDRAVVLGVSAGAPSATQFALRHPGRVGALVLVNPALNAPGQQVQVDRSFGSQVVLRIVMSGADLAWWSAMKVGPRATLVRFLGVPPEVEAVAPAAERDAVTALIASVLPLSERLAGLQTDVVGDPEAWPLEAIRAPTLIVSATDDLFNTLPGARYAAGRIPGARLAVFPTGGHLLVGRGDEVRRVIAEFLAAAGIGAKSGE
ncbi:MAG TPA: alpha/beta hydrolase [Hyphomicrobiaceae bacterium]|jgi:pimeloyl-ACP methyl ester carboxylesterase|nr:alpha/beta hydrolase [Hyphomicrobiaceae bacterium]